MFIRWLFPSSFANGSTLLSLGLVPHPVCSSPWQVFHISGISNLGVSKAIQASPSSFTQWPSGPPCLDSPATCLVSLAFLNLQKQLLSELFRPLIVSSIASASEDVLEFCLSVRSVVSEQACLYYFCSFNNSLTSCAWATVWYCLANDYCSY